MATVRATKKSTAQRVDDSLALVRLAARVAAESRGQDIVALDMRELTPLFDYFLIITGRSGRQIRAIADDIDHALLEQLADKYVRKEGYKESRWVVLDYGDVLIHVFDEELRDFYRLEELWADAKRAELELPARKKNEK